PLPMPLVAPVTMTERPAIAVNMDPPRFSRASSPPHVYRPGGPGLRVSLSTSSSSVSMTCMSRRPLLEANDGVLQEIGTEAGPVCWTKTDFGEGADEERTAKDV